MYLIDVNGCPKEADFELTDVSSKLQMENKGWSFDIMYHQYDPFKNQCGMNDTWYGFNHPGDGKITATFTGSGTATLDYGNCLHLGEVNVYLNGTLIDVAHKNMPSKKITFDFSPYEVLSISETNGTIIKLNSLELASCKGKSYFHSCICAQSEMI